MASAKKAAGNGAPAMPVAAGSKKAPANQANGAPTTNKRGKVIIQRSAPVLYPERELPQIPEFTNRELTNARNTYDMKNKIRLDYSVNRQKNTREIKRYRDTYEPDTNEQPLDKYLEESIAKNLFPAELVKKTVTRRRKKKVAEGDALNALNKLADGTVAEDAEEEEEEEGEDGEKKAKAKEKKKEDEGSEESDEESEESDGGMDYNQGGMVDDDDEGMDDDDGGGDDGYD